MTAHTVTAGATSSGIVLRNGDELDVLSGGVAIDTVVSSGGGGAAYVYNGGQVNGTSGGGGGGGTEYVYNGGTASGSAIDMGGAEMVLSGGVASAIAIRTGGSQLVNTGGTASFAVVSMGSTLIGLMVAPTAPAPCFAAGTRIATDRGRFAVETLRPGDLVLLQDGRIAPIVWIGHRRVDCARHPHPEQAWPFRVAAGAFGPGLPRRDLYLSPDHAVLVTGALVPIKYLAAGVDIVQVPWAEATYFHIELDAHDVLLAEGLPVESYLDTGDRARFDNGGKVATLHPDFSARALDVLGCAKLVLSGPALEAARRHVARALGLRRRTRPSGWHPRRTRHRRPLR